MVPRQLEILTTKINEVVSWLNIYLRLCLHFTNCKISFLTWNPLSCLERSYLHYSLFKNKLRCCAFNYFSKENPFLSAHSIYFAPNCLCKQHQPQYTRWYFKCDGIDAAIQRIIKMYNLFNYMCERFERATFCLPRLFQETENLIKSRHGFTLLKLSAKHTLEAMLFADIFM